MKTFDEQRAFFLEQWPILQAALQKGGAEALGSRIEAYEEGLEKRVLYLFLRQKLGMGEEADFEAYAEVARRGIRMGETEAERASKEEDQNRRFHFAHILAFNLGADLAPCWPKDSLRRSEVDYQVGAWAGAKCLELAERMGSDAGTWSNDFWLLGMHELALGNFVEARDAWSKGVHKAWEAEGVPVAQRELGVKAPFGVLLQEAKRSLARLLLGDPEGRVEYERCLEFFREQAKDKSKADDAQFGLAQCEEVRQRFVDKE